MPIPPPAAVPEPLTSASTALSPVAFALFSLIVESSTAVWDVGDSRLANELTPPPIASATAESLAVAVTELLVTWQCVTVVRGGDGDSGRQHLGLVNAGAHGASGVADDVGLGDRVRGIRIDFEHPGAAGVPER